MVATRGHPTGLPDPTETPTKRVTRSSAVVAIPSATSTPSNGAPSSPRTSKPRTRSSTARASLSPDSDGETKTTWAHTPSKLTLFWMAVSLPLVIWDTGYVLLRPYSMPGGNLHYPIWVPYELYGRVDHMYGFKQWNLNNGWTAAQGTINALETTVYLVYLYLVYKFGVTEENVKGRGAPDVRKTFLSKISESRTVEGKAAVFAVLLMFSTAMVTFWKTVLYWLIELYSGFDNIGHNTVFDIILLYIIPNGAWLVFPAYLIYVFGAEIVEGLDHASVAKKEE